MEKMARALVRLIGKVTSAFPFIGKIYAGTGACSATVTCTDVEPLVVLSDSSVPASTHAPSLAAPPSPWFRPKNSQWMLQTRARFSRPPYGGG